MLPDDMLCVHADVNRTAGVVAQEAEVGKNTVTQPTIVSKGDHFRSQIRIHISGEFADKQQHYEQQ